MKKQLQLAALLVMCSIGSNFAQQRDIPSIKIKDSKDEFLKLERLTISVAVVENIASTTMEMTFFNETNRILEGELNFPLAEGETVSRFAMDVNGTLREGVVVDKEKGTEVFESIVRRGVDPGLLEMTKGNNFKARVYPIPANGYKKIVIAYEHELKIASKQYCYLLPLNYKDPLKEFSVHVEVINQDIEPLKSSNELLNLKFTKSHNSYISDFTQQNFKADKQLGFTLPMQEKPKEILTFKGTVDTTAYFYINSEPQKESKQKIKPLTIALYYDISASTKKRDKDKEFALLDSYFKWLGNVTANIVTFSNTIEISTRFEVTNGNWQSIKTLLQNIVPDGGTQLGALDFNNMPCDEILLFTDGLSNYGKDNIVISKTPIVTINSNVSADHNTLNYLAQKTAGYYVNLNTLTIDEAVKAMTHQNLEFLFAEYSANEISDVYPSTPTNFTSNFAIAGKVKTPQAKISLHFGYGNQTSYTKEYVIINENPIKNNLTERIWVQKKLADLSANYEKNKDEITRVGKKYSVVTKTTSLIVLDNISDYIRYQITPPAEMQNEYFALLRKTEVDKKEAYNKHIEAIYNQYQEKIKWWETDFQKIIQEKREKAIKDSILLVEAQKRRLLLQKTLKTESRVYSSNYKLITGAIVNKYDGAPIQGATITIKDTPTNTTSDYYGNFEMSVPVNALLKIHCIGYKTVVIDYKEITSATINMEANSFDTNEEIGGGTGFHDEVKTMSVVSNTTYDRGTDEIEAPPVASNSIRYTPPVIRADRDVNEEENVVAYENNIVTEEEQSPFIIIESDTHTTVTIEEPNTSSNGRRSTIALNAWEPNSTYLDSLKKSPKANLYETYLSLRNNYAQMPSFFLDVATYLYEKGERKLAIKVLSNLAEMDLQNHEVLRVLGRKLMEFNEIDAAITIFKKVLEIRSFEPHSYRDLGLAYADNKQYQLAIETLYQIITKEWNSDINGRFRGIESIVLGEINSIIAKAGTTVNTSFIDSRFLKNLPLDIRIVLNWDADNCDMDLWVTDPHKEQCLYSHNRTEIGGYMSRDMTRGYGPEEFLLRKADNGNYTIEVNYYGSTQQTLSGPVTLQVLLFTNFGKKNEVRKQMTVRLSENKEVLKIGNLTFKSKP